MIVTLATPAMGTRFELVLAGDDESHLRAAGEEAITEIQLWHQRLNYFAPDSLVRRINTLASIHPVALDPETFALLARCVELHDETAGTFDITIAPLMRQWGFRALPAGSAGGSNNCVRDFGQRRPAKPGPNGCAFATRYIHLDHAARTVRFTHPGLEIDFGGIAKGFALDQAAHILRENGISCALLHGGTSSVVTIGAPPHADGWKIRISGGMGKPGLPVAAHDLQDHFTGKRSPCPWHHDDSAIDVQLRDQSLSISAPHGRTVEHNGETLGHIIDPRTGAPARGADLAAVICNSATDAEAWSTALLVLNERPLSLPEEMTWMLYDRARGWRVSGADPVSRSWCGRAQPEHRPDGEHVAEVREAQIN
jgi:thiamine biosynthesis lipoprotein